MYGITPIYLLYGINSLESSMYYSTYTYTSLREHWREACAYRGENTCETHTSTCLYRRTPRGYRYSPSYTPLGIHRNISEVTLPIVIRIQDLNVHGYPRIKPINMDLKLHKIMYERCKTLLSLFIFLFILIHGTKNTLILYNPIFIS